MIDLSDILNVEKMKFYTRRKWTFLKNNYEKKKK